MAILCHKQPAADVWKKSENKLPFNVIIELHEKSENILYVIDCRYVDNQRTKKLQLDVIKVKISCLCRTIKIKAT